MLILFLRIHFSIFYTIFFIWVQVGVGDQRTTISPVPASTRSGFNSSCSGKSTPVRKLSTDSRSLVDWLSDSNAPPPPPRTASSKSQSPIVSPLSKTGGFFNTVPHPYGRTVSEPGDFAGGSYSEYANVRELRSPLKDQRLTPGQQDKIVSYYTSKLRKNSDPGNNGGMTMGRSPIDDLASDILAHEARKNHGNFSGESRVDSAFLSRMEQREPPARPPKPGAEEDPGVPPPLPPRNRQEILEERHQELLKKQKQLQVLWSLRGFLSIKVSHIRNELCR